MSSHRNDTNSVVQLPSVLAIGFTGHRKLPDESASRKLIYDFLADKQATAPVMLYGVTSVAAGGDLLFAESCIALNIPLRVLLPFPLEEFRKDFDAAAWARAEEVMQRALSIVIVGRGNLRNERYYECGIETVLQSQLLLALWNGQPAQGLGGTEQIIAFARQIGRDIFWINSSTGAVELPRQSINENRRDSVELRFLNKLPASIESLPDTSPSALAQAWLAKLDANAVRVAPQVRRFAAFPIVLTALAAFSSAASPHMKELAATWSALGAVCGLLATALPVALNLAKRQALWTRIRTAAEVTRSFLALWHVPGDYRVVGPEVIPELNEMLLSLNYLKSQTARSDSFPLDDFREHYLTSRLLDQKHYFDGQARKAAHKAHNYRNIAKLSTVIAITFSAWVFLAPHLFKSASILSRSSILSIAASALFQIATVAGALVVVHDCDRRQKRYQELHLSLTTWENELRGLHTWSTVTQVVEKIERALIVELLEWRSLLQNMKMPRN